LHEAELVKFNHRLGQVEVNGAAFGALAVEDLGKLIHQLKVDDHVWILAAQDGVAFNDGVHVCVRHAVSGADDAFSKVIADDFSLAVKLHDAGEDETVKVGAERANISREFEREHGHGAVREINRGAARAGFFVDGGAVFDILGHVCDVDLQLIVAAGQSSDENGVVKVASGFAINGDDGEIAEVAATGDFLWGNDGADLL